MPDFCSCGAELPAGALFCHKCGKPQREIATGETEPESVVPPLPPPAALPQEPLPVSFRNPVAVRIGLLLAVAATVLTSFLPFLNWLAAGFFAVFFYRRKTGLLVNVGAGVRMGWITGLLAFGLAAIMSLAIQLPAALSGQLAKTYQQAMKNFPFQDPAAVQQVSKFMATPPGAAAILALTLASLFVFTTFLSMAGGALAAKLGQANQPRGGSNV